MFWAIKKALFQGVFEGFLWEMVPKISGVNYERRVLYMKSADTVLVLLFMRIPGLVMLPTREQGHSWFPEWPLRLNPWSIWGVLVSILTMRMAGPFILRIINHLLSGKSLYSSQKMDLKFWPGNRSATCIQGLKFYKKFLTLYILCHIIEAVDLRLYIF